MKPPLILHDNGDISLFQTKEELGQYVESPDIQTYQAFDSVGKVLLLEDANSLSEKKNFGLIPINKVIVTESNVEAAEELETLLRDFLLRVTRESCPEKKLTDLIVKLVKLIGYTK